MSSLLSSYPGNHYLALPPVTSHQSQITKPFRIRTYGKSAANPFIIRTSKTQAFKPFRIRTYRKTRGGDPYQE